MKIPGQGLHHNGDSIRIIRREWDAAAIQVGLETGVYVEVGLEERGLCVVRIFFKIADHQFEDLTALRIAVKNKAFI